MKTIRISKIEDIRHFEDFFSLDYSPSVVGTLRELIKIHMNTFDEVMLICKIAILPSSYRANPYRLKTYLDYPGLSFQIDISRKGKEDLWIRAGYDHCPKTFMGKLRAEILKSKSVDVHLDEIPRSFATNPWQLVTRLKKEKIFTKILKIGYRRIRFIHLENKTNEHTEIN